MKCVLSQDMLICKNDPHNGNWIPQKAMNKL